MCHNPFPELSPRAKSFLFFAPPHTIAVPSLRRHCFPASLTDPPRSCPICPKGPHTPIHHCSQSARQTLAHALQVCQALHSVTRASCDSRATTRHGGRLVGHPSRRQAWALGVPTLVSCYSGFIYIIDGPLQAPGLVDLHPPSFPDRWWVICIPICFPWCCYPPPSCGQPP